MTPPCSWPWLPGHSRAAYARTQHSTAQRSAAQHSTAQHTAHGTRHTAHGTRHTAHGTRHTAHGKQHKYTSCVVRDECGCGCDCGEWGVAAAGAIQWATQSRSCETGVAVCTAVRLPACHSPSDVLPESTCPSTPTLMLSKRLPAPSTPAAAVDASSAPSPVVAIVAAGAAAVYCCARAVFSRPKVAVAGLLPELCLGDGHGSGAPTRRRATACTRLWLLCWPSHCDLSN